MKIDLYTKAALTVIAACLVWICIAQTWAPSAQAQGDQRVVLVGIEPTDGAVPVLIRGIERGRTSGDGRYYPWQPLPVDDDDDD